MTFTSKPSTLIITKTVTIEDDVVKKVNILNIVSSSYSGVGMNKEEVKLLENLLTKISKRIRKDTPYGCG